MIKLHGNLGMHKCILLDVDGTLIDSSPGLYKSFIEASNFLGLENVDENYFKKNIGPPIDIIFTNIFDLDKKIKEKFINYFRKDYDNKGYLGYKSKTNIEILKKIISNNIQLGIVTNKPTLPTLNILKDMKAVDFFSDIICKDTYNTSFTKRENLKKIINNMKDSKSIKKSEIIYIGDTLEDLDAATYNNIAFAAVSDGFYDWSLNQNNIDVFPSLNSILNKYIKNEN